LNAGQVTEDTSIAFHAGAINTNRSALWGADGLVGYDLVLPH
jgi:hypothetical protein